MDITFILYLLIYLIEALILLQYVSALFHSKYSKLIECIVLLLLYIGLFMISFFKNSALNITSFLLVNFIFMSFMYQIKWNSALFHASISTAVMGMSELVLYSIMPHFILDFFSAKTYFRNIVVLTVFSKTLYFIILFILSQVFGEKSKNNRHQSKTSFFLIGVPFITIFVMSTLFIICENTKLSVAHDWMISFSSILLLINNLLIFAINSYTQKKNHEFTEMQLLLQKEYDSTEYYKMLLQQNENQSILIHDIKQHLHSIAILNSNRESEKIAAYIESIIHSSNFQNSHQLCDHEMLNIILSRYQKQCLENQINFLVDIRSNTVDFISDNDLTALFCNLLDNALKSASQMPESFIELNVNNGDNTPFTILTMANSCRRSPFTNNNELITSKSNKLRHGFGLKSIRRIVKKYNGEIKMYYDGESISFHTIITLKR